MPEGVNHQRPTTMHQRSFASAEFALKKKRTRREVFLGEMERVVPWSRLEAVTEPLYPKSGRVGRQPIGVSRMYCLQQWYGLADEALEDALYDSQALRDFVGIDLSRESMPDATTLLKFRHLLVDNQLTRALFDEINAHLSERGLLMRAGTIVDATIIAAPSSTKNQKGERDPEMHQTKKGNQWHFGMKAHIGVDAESGLVPSVVGTAANVNDITQAGVLLHGQETAAFGDAGYRGVDKREEAQGPTWHVAMQPGKRRALDQTSAWQKLLEQAERLKASVRAKVEHPFHVVKNLFRHRKVRYRGLAKNQGQLFTLFGLANLKGLMLKAGTVVDATLISAPSSTKNESGERNPEMKQSRKGNQWHFGMKAYIGVDAESGLVHTVIGTACNVNDIVAANSLLHDQEATVFPDLGYRGAHKRPDAKPSVEWHIAVRPIDRRRLRAEAERGAVLDRIETLKASIRAKVEHPFRVIKRQFGHTKVRYRGLFKNTVQLKTLFALSNLWMARAKLMALDEQVRPLSAKAA